MGIMEYYFKLNRCVYYLLDKLSHFKIFSFFTLCASILVGLTFIYPVLGFWMILNEIGRLIYRIYLWVIYGSRVQLNDDECGSNYATMRAQNRHTILYLGEIQGRQDVESLRENYERHVLPNPAYWKLACVVEPGWFHTTVTKCQNFNIRNHIRYYPGSEERLVTENELLHKILPELSHDMPPTNNPQWEEVVIPQYQNPDTNETTSLRIIRMHHAYMDGASTLLMVAHAMSGEGDNFPFVVDPCKPPKISRLAMFLYKLTCHAYFSAVELSYIWMPPLTRKSRFSIPWDSEGQPLFSWTRKIPVERFRNIKTAAKVSMPAVVTSVMCSAIRKFEERYPLSNKIPNTHPLWVVAGMFPYRKDKAENRHTAVELQANTSSMSCVKRLEQIEKDLGRLATNPVVTIFFWLHKIMGRIPCCLSDRMLSYVSCPAILSNLPLTTRNIKMFERECYELVGWVPLLARNGLGVVTVRYANHFRYCVQADSNVMNQQQLDYFIQKIEQQLDELFVETYAKHNRSDESAAGSVQVVRSQTASVNNNAQWKPPPRPTDKDKEQ